MPLRGASHALGSHIAISYHMVNMACGVVNFLLLADRCAAIGPHWEAHLKCAWSVECLTM